jgi:hypothetical protein
MTYSVGNGTSGSPQAAETITLPSYPSASNPVIAGTSNLPTTYTTNGAGTTLTIKISQANFDNVSSSVYSGTADFFTSLEVDPNALGLGNGSDTLLIPVTITSPCVTAGTTYTVTEYDSTLFATLYTETDTASGTTVTGHIQASVNPFTAGQDVDVIVSH